MTASFSSIEQPVQPSNSSSSIVVLPQSAATPAITVSPPDAAQMNDDSRPVTSQSTGRAMGLKKRAFADEFRQQVEQATQEGIDFLRMQVRMLMAVCVCLCTACLCVYAYVCRGVHVYVCRGVHVYVCRGVHVYVANCGVSFHLSC